MNVIRMIKLFGWEAKMSDQIAEKREDELRQIRKFEMLKLLNENIRYVYNYRLQIE